jgi:hypothetical protein
MRFALWDPYVDICRKQLHRITLLSHSRALLACAPDAAVMIGDAARAAAPPIAQEPAHG